MKKTSTDYDLFEQSSLRNRQLLREEELIVAVTEALSAAMEEDGVKKAQLAERLGKTKGFVTQLLAGGRNLTLRTIANLAGALGYRVQITLLREALQKQDGFEGPQKKHQNDTTGGQRSRLCRTTRTPRRSIAALRQDAS